MGYKRMFRLLHACVPSLFTVFLLSITLNFIELGFFGLDPRPRGVSLAIWFVFPIIEEVLFRGVLLSLLLKYFSVTTSCIVSSLAFALCHYSPYITPVLVGLYFSLLLIEHKSLLLCIFLHYLFNILVSILQCLFAFCTLSLSTEIFLFITMLALTIVAIYFTRNDFHRLFKHAS